jgi:hypothetical protein
VQSREKGAGIPAELLQQKEAVARLAASSDARELIRLLGGVNGVGKAARAAAGGDTGALKQMVEALMQTEEGAELTRRIGEQARQAGLE